MQQIIIRKSIRSDSWMKFPTPHNRRYDLSTRLVVANGLCGNSLRKSQLAKSLKRRALNVAIRVCAWRPADDGDEEDLFNAEPTPSCFQIDANSRSHRFSVSAFKPQGYSFSETTENFHQPCSTFVHLVQNCQHAPKPSWRLFEPDSEGESVICSHRSSSW